MKEVFDAIDKVCTDPAKDMGDCRNRRIKKINDADFAERYTRLGLGAGPHWGRIETNERAFFFSRGRNIAITIAQRQDGTFCLIPPDREIEDLSRITRYFIEIGLMSA